MLAFNTVYVKPGQSLIDVAIEHYGNVEGVFALLSINSSKLDAIHSLPEPGTQLFVHVDKPVLPQRDYASQAIATNPVYYTTPPAAQYPSSGNLIHNNHEPLNSNDPPQPAVANYYRGDDYVYHYVDGRWKRTTIVLF